MNPWNTGNRGQLLLPMLAVLFIFGMAWALFAKQCAEKYWKMRMDVAADLAALSGARAQAQMLNSIGMTQLLMNTNMTKVHLFGKDGGLMALPMKPYFDANYYALRTLDFKYKAEVLAVTHEVARRNGATVAIPKTPDLMGHMLKPRDLYVLWVYPPRGQIYRQAFFARDWSPRKTNPQPPHRQVWTVCRNTTCSIGRARLWHDVVPHSWKANGGFPPPNPSFLRGLEFQCLYPQFNAVLETRREPF